MKRRITFLRRTCQQAAALLIAREDRALAFSDRVALKLHLLACEACPKFEVQVSTMRAAMGQWRHYGNPSSDAPAAGIGSTRASDEDTRVPPA